MAGTTVATIDELNAVIKRVEAIEHALKTGSTPTQSPAVEAPTETPVEAQKPVESTCCPSPTPVGLGLGPD